MTEEEKIVEVEKSREEYFYVNKEKTYQAITNIATSFIGASLALLVFTALHKPPMPPCGMGFNRPMPCPMQMMDHRRPPHDFQNNHEQMYGHRKFHKDFSGKKHLGGHRKFDKKFPGKDINKKMLPPDLDTQPHTPQNNVPKK